MSDDRKSLVWFIGARAGEIPRAGFCPWKAFAGCHAPFNHTIGISFETVSSCVGGAVLEGCLEELEEPQISPAFRAYLLHPGLYLLQLVLGLETTVFPLSKQLWLPFCLQPAASPAHRRALASGYLAFPQSQAQAFSTHPSVCSLARINPPGTASSLCPRHGSLPCCPTVTTGVPPSWLAVLPH